MTPPGTEAPPADGVRVIAGIAGAGLLVWTLFALFGGTTVTFEPIDDNAPTVTAQCDPLITLFGSGQSFYASDGNSRLVNFEVIGPTEGASPMTESIPDRDIEAECDRRQLASAGLIALLAAPTAVLGMIAMSVRRYGAVSIR